MSKAALQAELAHDKDLGYDKKVNGFGSIRRRARSRPAWHSTQAHTRRTGSCRTDRHWPAVATQRQAPSRVRLT